MRLVRPPAPPAALSAQELRMMVIKSSNLKNLQNKAVSTRMILI